MGEKLTVSTVTSDPKEFRKRIRHGPKKVSSWGQSPFAEYAVSDHGEEQAGAVWQLRLEVGTQTYTELVIVPDEVVKKPDEMEKIFLVTLYDRAKMLGVGFSHKWFEQIGVITGYQSLGIEPLSFIPSEKKNPPTGRRRSAK